MLFFSRKSSGFRHQVVPCGHLYIYTRKLSSAVLWLVDYCSSTRVKYRPLISPNDIVSNSVSTNPNHSDTEHYRSVWCQAHYDNTDKNNNVSFKGLDINYQVRIAACSIRLAAILIIMSILTLNTDITPYSISICIKKRTRSISKWKSVTSTVRVQAHVYRTQQYNWF
jgi:hypothetical protein